MKLSALTFGLAAAVACMGSTQALPAAAPDGPCAAPFTYAAWLHPGDNNAILFSTSSADPATRPAWKELHLCCDEIHFSGNASGGFHARARIHDGQWHHIAFVSDPEAKKQYIYVDGELKETGNCDMKPDAPRAELLIARGFEEMGHTLFSYIGGIDDVRLHGRALSAEEIRTAMNGRDIDAKGAAALRLKFDGDAAEVARIRCGDKQPLFPRPPVRLPAFPTALTPKANS